jgi:hypothetical protein
MYDLTFKIYPDSTLGTMAYWTEVHASVEVSEGLYNIILGSVTELPDTVFQGEERWLGVTVDSDPEIRPLMLVTAVPWAFRAAVADSALNVGSGDDGDWVIAGDTLYSAVSGNVGIGISDPRRPLHVKGNADNQRGSIMVTPYELSSDLSSELVLTGFDGSQGVQMVASGLMEYRFFAIEGGGHTYLSADYGYGNVGIGTLLDLGNPDMQEQLVVDGAVKLGNTANTNEGTIRWSGTDFEGYDGSEWKSLTTDAGGSGDGHSLDAADGAPVDVVYVENDGEVRIGEEANGYDVSIHGDSTGSGLLWDSARMALRVGRDTTGTYWPPEKIGFYSVAMGYNTEASGDYSMSLGRHSVASAPSSYTFGAHCIAAGWGATAIGESATAGGNQSIALGSEAQTVGYMTTAVGYNVTAEGNFSVAIGESSHGVAEQSIAIGTGNCVAGETGSAAIGVNAVAEGPGSFSIGKWVTAGPANNAFVIGVGESQGTRLENNISNSLVVGFDTTEPSLFVGGTNHRVGVGTTDPQAKLHVDGDFRVGSNTTTGELELHRSGHANPVVKAYSNSHGGQLACYDESGNGTILLEPDANGTGGYFYMRRNAINTGFRIDANDAASEQPSVEIVGDTRMAAFRMNETGNDAVVLNTDAISNSEILDEPGAASDTEGTNFIILDGTVQTLLSRSITVPASGYVQVIGTCQPIATHTNGTQTYVNFGVSQSSSSMPLNQDIAWGFPGAAATGDYQSAITVHGLFTVSSGTHTFYFLANEASGDVDVYDMQLTLVYIPTAYGTIESTLLGAENLPDEKASEIASKSGSDIAAERVESEVANRERVERELAAMQAKLDALKEELKKIDE